ncbi:hypothetical protein MTO96_014095 [Rhipicephalus appendiculatus]
MLDHLSGRESRNSSKMCITMSVAPWMFEAQPPIVLGQLPKLDALSSSGEHPGFASAYEMCRSGPVPSQAFDVGVLRRSADIVAIGPNQSVVAP